MTIWKYPLELKDSQAIKMPIGAEILSVDNQDGQLCLWARVDEERTKEYREIVILGTGNPIEEEPSEFIGTLIVDSYVWHIFEN